MRSRLCIIVMAAVLAGIALVLARREVLATRAVRIAVSAAEKRRVALQAQIQQLEKWQAALEENAARPASPAGSIQTSPVEAKPSEAITPTPTPADLIYKDPQLQVLYFTAARSWFTMLYGPFFASLHLGSEQQRHMVDILIHQEEQNNDLMAVARSSGLSLTDPAILALKKQITDEAQTTFSGVLGSEGYEKLTAYDRTLQLRVMMGQIAGELALTNQPLDAGQAEKMTMMMAAQSSAYAQGGRAMLSTIDWDEADRQAAQILTPAQFDVYRTIEPLGGSSRFTGRLTAAIAQATKADVAAGLVNSPKN